ncbi:MAG TPA: radical SAM protein [Vicinamibacteria bacterium]|nr:radical SAM protein [Vicinamibacteria bacterium]
MEMLQQIGDLAWRTFQSVNTRVREGAPVHPGWAPGALPKSYERTRPPLGYPRETDSLCPRCVIEARRKILSGDRDLSYLVNGHVGEIRATFHQKGRELWMTKTCPEHGTFDDLRSIDVDFDRVIERRYPGRDFRTLADQHVHRHGSSTVRYGRGAVLTVDLTNRCNMMCNPCFMDANQVGYVHELTFDEVKKILDDSISFKPRRQMVVQYSGGEPTLSPLFLEACAYAKKIGYKLVQAATNGLRFALEPEFAFQAKEAGLDMVYLQFDGTSNESNAHRHITNLFDVKTIAIDNLAAAGVAITPVVTIVNGVNNHQVGPIFDFCLAHYDKMGGPAFQPVSFTGRDEEVSDEVRLRQRYTTSHLAHDLARYYEGRIDPYRDWYPLGASTAFAALADHLQGPEANFGQLNCGCHPNCGAATMMVANHRTGQWATLMSFFDLERFFLDLDLVVDSARGRTLTLAQIGLSFLRNFDERKAPSGLTPRKLLQMFNGKMGGGTGSEGSSKRGEWRLTSILSMWFQDLWNYDFRRTEMCVIPYGTQEGEISFCAYNTGVGWRQIIEEMRQVASTQEWFHEKGRHQIYAGNRPIPLPNTLKRRLPVVAAHGGNDNGNGHGEAQAGAGETQACGAGCGCH